LFYEFIFHQNLIVVELQQAGREWKQ